MQNVKSVSFDNVKIDLLKVDKDYQKEPYDRRIDQIVKTFNSSVVGELTVSKRHDGFYYIIDGQHRCAALKRKGYKTARCIVHEGLSVTEEAEIYSGLGNRAQQAQNEKFKVDLLLGVKYAVEIYDVVKMNGLDICFDRSGRGIKCCATLKAIHKTYGVPVIDEVLQIINGAFPGNGEAFIKHIIKGFSLFVAAHGETVNKKRLIEKLNKIGFEAFNAKANAFIALGKEKGVKEAILHFYNYQNQKKIGEI